MATVIEEIKKRAIQRKDIGFQDGLKLFEAGMEKPFYLLAAASDIREHFKGRFISLCGIVNAKSGRCSENCKFCAQSAHHKTDAPVYPLISAEDIIKEAKNAAENGAHFFGIVTSGKRISGRTEWAVIHEAVKGIHDLGLKTCASLGIIDRQKAIELKEAGLFRYHHNLETSRSFFRNICTTHDYDEDVETVRAAKEAGLSTCCGGLFGLGEDIRHRIELAMTLKELDVDSVPVNILNPIPGTPLATAAPLSPMEILITIAIFRFILPEKDIKLCGGKEKNLRQLLPLGITAGCNSLMTGNYLTTLGRNTALDLEMIRDLGLTAKEEDGKMGRWDKGPMKGKILAVNISDKKGEKKHDIGECMLVKDFGLSGDAHGGFEKRQVSLLAMKSIDKMSAAGIDVGYGDFAENLTTEGIELHTLPVGTKMRVGGNVLLRITQIGKVCHDRCAIFKQVGDCVMPREGIFAEVLTGGEVRIGDTIEVIT